jgi:hypothetical protein
MSEAQLPEYAELAAELASLEAGLDPSELHGSLCGYLAGGGKHDARTWFAQVMSDPLLSAPDAGGPLDRLYVASARQLESPDFEFELLLPPEDRPVSERGDGLLAWGPTADKQIRIPPEGVTAEGCTFTATAASSGRSEPDPGAGVAAGRDPGDSSADDGPVAEVLQGCGCDASGGWGGLALLVPWVRRRSARSVARAVVRSRAA